MSDIVEAIERVEQASVGPGYFGSLRTDDLKIILAEIRRLRAEVEALRGQFDRACDAADRLFGPICAEAGRIMSEMPDEDMTPHLPPLEARLFDDLYEATNRAALQEKRDG